MPSYPHMLDEDVRVWSAYLAGPVEPITELWYDMRVGEPIGLPDDADEVDRKIADGVSRKRIDVVCRVYRSLWVVEVKPFGSMFALGQVLTYTRLFVREFEPAEEVQPVIVCFNADRDLLDEFEEQGVMVIEV